MSEKLPPLPATRVIKVLEKAGFKKIRQRGSHIFMQHSNSRSTIVPLHKGEDLGPGLIKKIIRDTEINRNKFINLLRKH